MPRLATCPRCKGTGTVPARRETAEGYVTSKEECPVCNGGGMVKEGDE